MPSDYDSAPTDPHHGGKMTEKMRISRELAACANELAFWKHAAVWLQTAVILGRSPTDDDVEGKTWTVARARLEAQLVVDRTENPL